MNCYEKNINLILEYGKVAEELFNEVYFLFLYLSLTMNTMTPFLGATLHVVKCSIKRFAQRHLFLMYSDVVVQLKRW